MPENSRLLYLHGSESDSHSGTARLFRVEPVRQIAQHLFTGLTCFVVEDGHRLQKAVHELVWKTILA